MKYVLVVVGLMIALLTNLSCTMVATKSEDTITLKGFGGGEATWKDGYSIKKDGIFPELPPIKLEQ